MKALATSISVVLILAVVASFSVTGAISYNRGVEDEISIAIEKRNPWTSLDLNNKAEDFQFVIVTDRTGGRRPGVFTQAVEKINLLQPEFVMSVGDLIEGYTEDPGMWALEWAEFESKIAELTDAVLLLCRKSRYQQFTDEQRMAAKIRQQLLSLQVSERLVSGIEYGRSTAKKSGLSHRQTAAKVGRGSAPKQSRRSLDVRHLT